MAAAKKSITTGGMDLFERVCTGLLLSFMGGLSVCRFSRSVSASLKAIFEVRKHNSRVLYNIFPKEDVFFKKE